MILRGVEWKEVEDMNKYGGVAVILLIYIGATAIGLTLFGEGAYAAYFAAIVGTAGLFWVINNSKDEE